MAQAKKNQDLDKKKTREDVTADEETTEVETPAPAHVEDDIVTCRGAEYGGMTQMKRSEYDAIQKKKKGGKN